MAEHEFEQCPHEIIRATCGGCNCDCASCVAINARLAAPVPHPAATDPSDGGA